MGHGQLGKRLFFFAHHILSFFLIALLINYQFMPHPELDVKCEKKILVESLSAKSESFWKKKNDIFFVTFKKSKRFFLSVQLKLSPYMKTMKKSMIIASPPHPFLILANFFPASKKKMKNQSLKKHYYKIDKKLVYKCR